MVVKLYFLSFLAILLPYFFVFLLLFILIIKDEFVARWQRTISD